MLDRARLRIVPYVAVPTVVGAWMAVARWATHGPFGSDNDEYRMLADSLQRGSTLIAGVEGTRYPLGYPSVLVVVDALGLPVTGTAIVLNLLALAATAVLVGVLGARAGSSRLAGSVAATVLLLSVSIWDSLVVVMPDALFVLACTVALERSTQIDTRGGRIVLLALGALAVALKSMGLVLAAALAVHLWTRPALRKVAVVPILVAAVLTLGQSVLSGSEPSHTTGYEEVFWLVDPSDASKGSIGPVDLPERVIERADVVARDVRAAVLGPHNRSVAAGVVVAILLALGLVGLRDRIFFAASFVAAQLVALAAWPYSSARFELVLVPYAAIGAACVTGSVARRLGGARWSAIALAAALALLVPYGLQAHGEAERRGNSDDERNRAFERDVAAFAQWMDSHVDPAELVASPDYRELAYRTDRTYLPVGYTLDADELWSRTAGRGATWYVSIRGLYVGRDRVTASLRSIGADRARPCVEIGFILVLVLDAPASISACDTPG